jgi:peptide/nickel transport system substrate-binding protein
MPACLDLATRASRPAAAVSETGLTRRAVFALAAGAAAARPRVATGAETEHRPRRGGSVTILVDPEPTTLVALTDSADPTMAVSAKVTEGLLAYDFDLKPLPQLAIAWAVADDARTFTFRLRPGVKWHDGVAFTSADVAFSIRLLRQVHPRGRATFANIADVETPDDLTAVVKLAKPAPYLIRAFAACESPMVPRHIYGDTDPTANPNGVAPIGTGPFRFAGWVKGSHVSLVRNAAYWNPGKPHLDAVAVRFMADARERVAALASGAIDLAPGSPVSPEVLDRLLVRSNLRVETNGYQYTNQVLRLEFNLDRPLIGELRVRKAIARAIDRAGLLYAVWRGHGDLTFGPISPHLQGFHSADVTRDGYDPAGAEQLLDLAGLHRGADGVRFRLDLDFVPAGEAYRATAEYVVQALVRIGIAVTLREQSFPSYVRRIYTDRDFDFSVSRANNMFDPTVGVQRLFWSKNFKRGVPFSNGSHYDNPEADALLEAAAVEADATTRREQFARFQNLVAHDLPDLTLLAPRQFTVFNPRVVDHTVTADGVNGNLSDALVVLYCRFGGAYRFGGLNANDSTPTTVRPHRFERRPSVLSTKRRNLVSSTADSVPPAEVSPVRTKQFSLLRLVSW